MLRVPRLVIACALGVAALGCRAPTPARPAPSNAGGKPAPGDTLGLGRGVHMRFAGTATTEAGDRPTRVEVRVRAEVRADDQVGWLVEDWPATEVWDPSDALAVIVRRGDTYHLGIVALAEEAAARAALTAGELPAGTEPWFRIPLRDGDTLCPDPDIVYCWSVEADGATFRVTYRTNPDDLTYVIDPARGLVGFEYHHHGTPNDLLLERVR